MRIANVNGRAVILTSDTTAIDVEKASGGRFGPDLSTLYEDWTSFAQWAGAAALDDQDAVGFTRDDLAAPSPAPRQIFGIGLNYSLHAKESGYADASEPPVFTKFITSLAAPDCEVELPTGGHTDWEVELVVVIGRGGRRIRRQDAWSSVAGLSVGQDISERISQLAGPAPQFSLGKSFPGFSPFGPWLVTPDEFSDPDDIETACTLDGEVVQQSRTSDLVFSVPTLIAHLSRTLPLLPGDVIFTGTPSGVGLGRTPPRYIQPGEKLVSRAEGIGEITQTFVAERA